MNVSNLSLNNVNIALANYVIKQLKFIPHCAPVRPLSDPLKWNHKNESITKVSITSVSWVRFVSGNYVLNQRNNYVLKFR